MLHCCINVMFSQNLVELWITFLQFLWSFTAGENKHLILWFNWSWRRAEYVFAKVSNATMTLKREKCSCFKSYALGPVPYTYLCRHQYITTCYKTALLHGLSCSFIFLSVHHWCVTLYVQLLNHMVRQYKQRLILHCHNPSNTLLQSSKLGWNNESGTTVMLHMITHTLHAFAWWAPPWQNCVWTLLNCIPQKNISTLYIKNLPTKMSLI